MKWILYYLIIYLMNLVLFINLYCKNFKINENFKIKQNFQFVPFFRYYL